MLPSDIIFFSMLLYTFVFLLDMVKHLLSLHYLYVIIVKVLLTKHILKASFFPMGSKKGETSMNRYN